MPVAVTPSTGNIWTPNTARNLTSGAAVPQYLAHRGAVQSEHPRRLADALPLHVTGVPNACVQVHFVHPPRLPSGPSGRTSHKTMKVGHFYAATADVPDRQGVTFLHRRLQFRNIKNTQLH